MQILLAGCAGKTPAATLDRLIARLPHPALLSVAAALEARTGLSPADLPAAARPLDWDEVRDLAGAGLDLGGHSVSHAALPNLPLSRGRGARSRAAATRSPSGSGGPPRHFAYPNGYHSPAIRRAVREAGFETGSTTEDRENVRGCDLFALRRKVLWESTTHGPLGYSQALATCSFEGVFGALRLTRGVAGERPDPAPERAEPAATAEQRAAS